MAITGKELAKMLGLSPSTVSMALNNQPGISEQTRQLVLTAAEQNGYDFTRHQLENIKRTIYFICYQESPSIFSYALIFDKILPGIMQECEANGFRLKVEQWYSQQCDLIRQITELRISDCAGIILLGTEIEPETAQEFRRAELPMVVVDSYLDTVDCTYILINNVQGAYMATDYLISRRLKQPGYLRSAVPLKNFDKRWQGFQRALQTHGMQFAGNVVHTLSPTIQGAEMDMLEVLERGDTLASCYFAENDLIALGAMKALKQKGYRIPEDIAVIGFDNISEGQVMEPGLTTIDIPYAFMGRTAAKWLIDFIRTPCMHNAKIEISTGLVVRGSV